ncbi:hypothetical protein Q460_18450, partial [Escherichia coli ATCC BAA-2219]
YPQLYTPEIFYEACRNLQSFYDHQETSQNAKYSAIDKKKSHLNQEIKKLIKKIFSLSYTMSNAIKSPPHR